MLNSAHGRARRRAIRAAVLDTLEGSSGEDAARALGTDSATLRPVMKGLIEEKKVKAKGKARGMRYTAV